MTILEAIIGSLFPYEVDESLIRKTAIDLDIDEEAEYDPSNRESVARATIFILQNLITLSSENNEGKSASYDVSRIKERISSIAAFNGLEDIASEYDTRSRIIDRTNMW